MRFVCPSFLDRKADRLGRGVLHIAPTEQANHPHIRSSWLVGSVLCCRAMRAAGDLGVARRAGSQWLRGRGKQRGDCGERPSRMRCTAPGPLAGRASCLASARWLLGAGAQRALPLDVVFTMVCNRARRFGSNFFLWCFPGARAAGWRACKHAGHWLDAFPVPICLHFAGSRPPLFDTFMLLPKMAMSWRHVFFPTFAGPASPVSALPPSRLPWPPS